MSYCPKIEYFQKFVSYRHKPPKSYQASFEKAAITRNKLPCYVEYSYVS